MTDKNDAAVGARIKAAQDAALRRDVELINAQTRKEQGYLPVGGLPIQPKRKPKPYERPQGSVPSDPAASAAAPERDQAQTVAVASVPRGE